MTVYVPSPLTDAEMDVLEKAATKVGLWREKAYGKYLSTVKKGVVRQAADAGFKQRGTHKDMLEEIAKRRLHDLRQHENYDPDAFVNETYNNPLMKGHPLKTEWKPFIVLTLKGYVLSSGMQGLVLHYTLSGKSNPMEEAVKELGKVPGTDPAEVRVWTLLKKLWDTDLVKRPVEEQARLLTFYAELAKGGKADSTGDRLEEYLVKLKRIEAALVSEEEKRLRMLEMARAWLEEMKKAAAEGKPWTPPTWGEASNTGVMF